MKQETMKTQIALIKKDVDYVIKSLNRLETSVNEVKKNTQDNFVTKSEFLPVKQIVYGLVGLLLTAVVGALVSLVLKK